MKFSVELNCAPKQNTRFSSSLQPYYGKRLNRKDCYRKKKHKNRILNEWQNVLLTDKSKFKLFGYKRRVYLRKSRVKDWMMNMCFQQLTTLVGLLWCGGDVCLCLPPDRTWHKVFFMVRCREGDVGHEPRLEPFWTYAGHRLSLCNVSQMTPLLVLDSVVSLARTPTHSLN